MNPFAVLHHYLCQNRNLNLSMPLNSYFFTHPTGQGPWVFRPILMFFWVWFRIHRYVEPFSVVPSVIITAREGMTSTMIISLKKWCIFTQKATNSNCTHEFYPLVPPSSPCRFLGDVRLMPLPLLLSFFLLLLTENKPNTYNANTLLYT